MTEFTDSKRQHKKPEDDLNISVSVPDFIGSDGLAPVVQMVDSLIETAVSRDASDIHLEPQKKGLKVRLRIDGVLRDYRPYSQDVAPLIISRLKIMGGMDIAERRLPQDGNLQVMVNSSRINIRLSTLPTIYGEKLMLRLLSSDKIIMPLETLGFNEGNYEAYLEFLSNTLGMLLVCGPTGCGKTTTGYSTLHAINNPEINIITVEDPVEYRLDGINQVQVNEKINLTFARILRTILRQDPDVIMIGEIHDRETAEIATRAALTGHLLLSTLHTNDAPGAVTRLLDMGVERFMLTSSLLGVVAQRLIRLNCRDCLERYLPEKDELFFYEKVAGAGDMPSFFRGRGCEKCDFTGFRGRTAIHEVISINGAMRKLIMQSEDAEDIRRYALSRGMQTLLQDGMDRAAQGLTTLREVIQVAYTVF